MPTRLERLERRLAEAAAAARASARRGRQASAERLIRALAAPTPQEQLAALEDPVLTRADRRRLRERVGVSLAPADLARPVRMRRGLADRLRVAVGRRLNPFTVVIALLITAPTAMALGTAWVHTGRGAWIGRTCRDVVLTRPDGTTQTLTLTRGDPVVVHGRNGDGVRVALWAPLTGYETATIPQACLAEVR
jgi:hypothetical protein